MRESINRRKSAVFLDRDGIVNDLEYSAAQGQIYTPLRAKDFHLMMGVAEGIKKLRAAGYMVLIASNQPGIAKGQFDNKTFEEIRAKMARELRRQGTEVDGELYCLHHPAAVVQRLRKVCNCRKPKPGLLTRGAQEYDLDLSSSFMIGDGLTDIDAGQRAGCSTILVSHWSSLLGKLLEKRSLHPTHVAENFEGAVDYVLAKS